MADGIVNVVSGPISRGIVSCKLLAFLE